MTMLLLVVLMFFSFNTQGFAKEINRGEVQTKLTDEIILSLTEDDLDNIYNILVDYKENNPDVTEEELDKIATEFYIETYNKKQIDIKPLGYYDDLLESSTGMNSQEVALSK